MAYSSSNKLSWQSKTILFLLSAAGKLPESILYRIADGIGWMLRKVVKYRLSLVREHLLLSFPRASSEERAVLESEIYRHLGDLAVEMCMLAAMDSKALRTRLHLEGQEILDTLYDQGHNIIYLALGHYGNWEWFTGFQDFLSDIRMHVLYKRQGQIMNSVMKHLRSKFGTLLLDKRKAPREILNLHKSTQKELLIFAADQTPSIRNVHLFTDFLNRSTAVFTGMERLAAKTHSPVCFLNVHRQQRGHYMCRIELLSPNASEEPSGMVSLKFMKRLEKNILENPSLWLWTHRRWKFTAEGIRTLFPDQHILVL